MDIIGRQFGRWTVLGDYQKSLRGERKWLCCCSCGTERFVLERSLKSGQSQSCGCLRRERAEQSLGCPDMEGRIFGQLTVLHRAEHQRKNGGIWWTCQCACGNQYDVPATLLITGRRTRCSGSAHEKHYASADITGERFHYLTALYALPQRDARKSVLWHCRCDCGNEIDLAYNTLVYSNIKSCGCQKRKHDKKLGTYLTHIAGTSLEMLKSEKVPVHNTTGVKGVYRVKEKWMAKIVFQKKQYHLGYFNEFENAVQARKDAESVICDGTVEHYTNWKKRADSDPCWAAANPIRIQVQKNQDQTISIVFLPVLEQSTSSN